MRDLLRSAIVHEEIKSGSLPSEFELMLAFSASRQVVRDALGMLRDEGLVTRLQGSGTLVTASKVQHAFTHVHGPSRRQVITHRLLTLGEEAVTPRVATKLGLASTTCGVVEYLTLTDDVPYYVGTAYVPVALLPVLEQAERASEWYAIYELAGIRLGVTDQKVEATVAEDRHAELLGISTGDPVMLFERLIRDHSGQPLEYAFVRVRGDRIVLTTQLSRQGPTHGRAGLDRSEGPR